MKAENVLVVRRSLFEELGAFQGFRSADASYLARLLDKRNNFFMSREAAEGDPSFKQIIPYAVFRCGRHLLHYVRGGKSGEKRLVAKGSIGIGGHINDGDETLFSFDESAYDAAVRREIAEELLIGCGWTHRVVGFLNDDSTEVGRVHLGVVHCVELETTDVRSGEKAIAELEFLDRGELAGRAASMETWSRILLEHWQEIGGC
jgi:predicted NUDIX family phosphoesterase